jgi:hypothetical protein
MPEQYGTALRTAMGQELVDVLAGGSMRLFSGSLPANCAAADPATTLATGTLPTPAATVSSGTVSRAGTWTFTGGAGAGTGTVATVYRLYSSGGTCVAQGSVTVTSGGGEMTIDNASIANAQVGAVNTYTRIMPGA